MLPHLTTAPTPCQEGVDRIGWTVGAVFTCHGARVGLRATTSSGLDSLVSWLPRAMTSARMGDVPVLYSLIEGGAQDNSNVKRFHILYRNFARLARSLDLSDVRRAFNRDLNMFIGENARSRVFVHAGVVAVGNGAVVIPGKSLSGKTTLTRALVEQGGIYYSDEYAVLDSKGRVSPWAEPLSIREDGPTRAGQKHSPESLGLRAGGGSLPIRLVVMTGYKKGVRFKPESASLSTGALGMLEHTLPARRRPRASLRALTSAVAGAKVLRGTRGDAAAAARAILRYLSDPPRR